ncbi:MAG: alpha/beta hydrolase, partial [Sciscionella sp.]
MTAVIAAIGGVGIYAAALPAQLGQSLPYAIAFGTLAIAQLATVAFLVTKPTRRRALWAAAPAVVVLVLWVVRILGVLPDPDPWQPVNAVIGITSDVCVALHAIAILGLAAVAIRHPRSRRSNSRRLLSWAVHPSHAGGRPR